MVLISHAHRFVFIKTKNTAGSAIEEFFERALLGAPEHGFSEITAERATKDSYVSGRGNLPAAGHYLIPSQASSAQIFTYLGEDRFSSYVKVSCVRNPWDQIVSFFWWRLSLRPLVQKVVARLPMGIVKILFGFWFYIDKKQIETLSFTKQFSIHGFLPEIRVIRYEKILEGLAEATQAIGLAALDFEIPAQKTYRRSRPEPYQAYYFLALKELVARSRSSDLSEFGYSWSDEDKLA